MNAFEIRYETEDALPPPFAHYFHLKATFAPDGTLATAYQLGYLGREELTEEEVISEGFTSDDDWQWRGTLVAAWADSARALLVATTVRKPRPADARAYLVVVFQTDAGEELMGEPRNRADWEFVAQELTQAIYETAGRERPLTVRFRHAPPGGPVVTRELTLHFATRTVAGQRNGTVAPAPDWAAAQALLRTVYALNFFPDRASPAEPRQSGFFLDPGDGHWYEAGGGVKNATKSHDALASLRAEVFPQ